MNTALIIFVRHPQLGTVKTRLAATIGDENALKVYQLLLQHTYDLIKNLPLHIYVYYAGEVMEKDLWSRENIFKKQQNGNNLGDRMGNAFTDVFLNGYEKVIIIGSDCYELTTAIIHRSIHALNENDIVIGPAKDGGYYLLGMKAPFKNVFENMEWSTATVFNKTMEKITADKMKVHILATLSDIDVEGDITFPY